MALSLPPTLRSFQRPPLPSQAAAEFQKAKNWLGRDTTPLSIEVGCGAGYHPIQWAKQNSDARLLAFERTSEKFAKALRRFENNGAPANIHISHADASILLPYLIKPQSADRFYFLYPNPYPKKRQSNLRLAFSPFLKFVRESLKPGGQLVLATNSALYADEVAHALPKQGFQLEKLEQISQLTNPRSHFEKKYLARGEACFNLVLYV